jgi:hypothetical protein
MAGDSQARVSSLIKNTERYWKNMRNTVIFSNLLSGSFQMTSTRKMRTSRDV